MKSWQELLEEIEQESDPKILHEKYHFEDNFALLLTVNDTQKDALERMLETYPKQVRFDKNLAMFGLKYYMVGSCVILYGAIKAPGIIERFTRESGEESNSNAFISFHPQAKSLAEQVLTGKQGVVEIARKLMDLGIPFESAVPSSRYLPS